MINASGNEQTKIISCQCGLTGGCPLCNPFIKPINYSRLFDPSYGHEEFQKGMDERAKNAVPIEKFKEVREKTKEIVGWKQYLTEEVLKECWDADKRPGGDLPNRTFDNNDDLIALYKTIKHDKKWKEFEDYLIIRWYNLFIIKKSQKSYVRWLLCFNIKEYELRCKLVAEFYGWKEEET